MMLVGPFFLFNRVSNPITGRIAVTSEAPIWLWCEVWKAVWSTRDDWTLHGCRSRRGCCV